MDDWRDFTHDPIWMVGGISRTILVKSEHFAGTTQPWVLVTLHSNQSTTGVCERERERERESGKCEISTTREAAQVDNITIVEANSLETRKGVGRETDTPREIQTETGSTQTTREIAIKTVSAAETAIEIEAGTVAVTETGSTR